MKRLDDRDLGFQPGSPHRMELEGPRGGAQTVFTTGFGVETCHAASPDSDIGDMPADGRRHEALNAAMAIVHHRRYKYRVRPCRFEFEHVGKTNAIRAEDMQSPFIAR